MHPRPLTPRLAPLPLLVLALVGSTALANQAPLAHPAIVHDPRAQARAPLERPIAAPAVNVADGVWHEYNLLQVSLAVSAYDAAHDQLQSIGGSRPECWALPLTGPPLWQPLPPAAIPRYLVPSLAAQDPATGLVYFLGPSQTLANEIDVLDPQTGAVNLIPASPGPSLSVASLIFDGATQRVILFGQGGPYYAPTPEVWALDLLPTPAWTQWAPTGIAPPTTFFNQAVLDPAQHRMLFPNVPGSGADTLWTLSLDPSPEWQHYATTGFLAGPLTNPVAYDAVSYRLWTIDQDGRPSSLSLATYQWSQIVPAGTGPSPRRDAGVAIDAFRHRLLVNGGSTPSFDDTHSDAFALTLDAGPLCPGCPSVPMWTELVHDALRPPIRGGASDGYDASRHRMIVFGGSNELGYWRNDTWILELGETPTWSPLATLGPLPPPRYWHSSVWDDAHDRLVVYGGIGPVPNAFGDVWTLSFSGGTPTWSEVVPAGMPPPRFLTQMVYDSARDRFLLLFGTDNSQNMQDVWELRLSPTPAWRQMAPSGTAPVARGAQMCAYDPGHDRVLMFGGGTNTDYLNDLWALNLGSGDGVWEPLPIPPGPSGRNLGLLRMDSSRNRLVLFGGYGVTHVEPGFIYIGYMNDAWALNLTGTPAWQALSPAGFLPRERDRANGAYDPIFDRLVLACGGVEGSNDLWTLKFADAPTPTLIDLAIRDVTPERVRLVWEGADPGMRVTAYRREAGAEWTSLLSILADGEGHVVLEDRDIRPGATLEYRLGVMSGHGEEYFGMARIEIPERALALTGRAIDGRAAFTVELPSGDPATLALFDVAGRQVWSRAVGTLGAGSHEVSAGDAPLQAGLYFARLTQRQATRFARVAIVR